jgi:sec-independent protein translocase protein TatA
LIIVVVFGWKKLPDAARSLGRSTRILKSELGDMNDSSASKETVQGQTTQPGQQQAPGTVPGESSAPPPHQQQPPQGHAPGQPPQQGQHGGPQAG